MIKKAATDATPGPSKNKHSLLDGLPALALPHYMSYDMRASRILGMKPNQIIRSVKECSTRIYRAAANSTHIERGESLRKEEIDGLHLSRVFADNLLRRQLLEEHARASFTGGKPERIPVIEYALLKAWRPELSLLRGEYGVSNSRAEAQEKDERDGKSHLLVSPFIVSHTSYYFFGINSTTPWERKEGFLPFWLARIGDAVLADLHLWEKKDKAQQAALAGAAFAVASALANPQMLIGYLDVEPRLGQYLEGVWGLAEEKAWDGSVWTTTEGQSLEHGRTVSGMAVLSTMQSHLVSTMDLNTIGMMRELLDGCEKLVSSVAASAINDARGHLIENKTRLEQMIADFKVTGRDFSFDAVIARVDAWSELLTDERMSAPGKEQSSLLKQLIEETTDISTALPSLIDRFKAVSEQHQVIIAGGLTWQEQCTRMQALNAELDAFQNECAQFNARFESRDMPGLGDVVTAEPENSEPDEAERLREAMSLQAQEIEKLKELNEDLALRASGYDSENDKLRQDNSDLRMQVENLQHAFSGGRDMAQATQISEALLGVIDEFAEQPSATRALQLLAAMYPDRVRILDSAYESAESNNSSLPVAALYQRIKILATQGLDVVRSTGRLIDMRELVPGDMTTQESDTVKGNQRLRAFRNFKDGETRRLVYPHLSLDYSHRLYFDYDPAEDRILIAYAGKHLPSAKNATV